MNAVSRALRGRPRAPKDDCKEKQWSNPFGSGPNSANTFAGSATRTARSRTTPSREDYFAFCSSSMRAGMISKMSATTP
jgi:hypothetical protein